MNRPRPRRSRSLLWRVFGSYLVVVAVAAVGALVAGEAFAPILLDRHMRSMGPMMSHGGDPMAAMAADLTDAYRMALTQSLAWAALVATVAAAVVAWSVTRRVVGPLADLREASRAIATGNYDRRLDADAPGEIGDLAGSFNTMAEALEQGEVIRRQLLSDLSHELRTPLSNLRGYVEALEDGVFTLDAPTSAALRRQVERLERLVADLSLLSGLEAGQVPVVAVPLDLAALVGDSAAAFRARFEERDVALAVDAPVELRVNADANRTAQVLENLLDNALRHTPAGGRVTVRARPDGALARVEVRDTGPGVPEALREAIFRRLYRGDPARAAVQGEGSGIGLTIARELVARQGGEIWVEGAGGAGEAGDGGACFVFTLPRVA
ncbi:MAG: HAMP domain-containing protein [Trueperaceae bacterium]|nr:HAMP domain-containing protein [Trueperaceae bacterium]